MTDTKHPEALRLQDLQLLEYLMSNVRYEDGSLFWTTSVQGRKAGSMLGCVDSRGYVRAEILRRKYAVHRLVLLMHNGWLPVFVDHIDGNPSNNRIENLRACSKNQNACNSKTRADSSIGVKGVCFHKASGKWSASAMYQGKRWQKVFPTIEEAAAASAAMRELMHKEFARHK